MHLPTRSDCRPVPLSLIEHLPDVPGLIYRARGGFVFGECHGALYEIMMSRGGSTVGFLDQSPTAAFLIEIEPSGGLVLSWADGAEPVSQADLDRLPRLVPTVTGKWAMIKPKTEPPALHGFRLIY